MAAPLRVLAIFPEPIDAPWSRSVAAAWTSFADALRAAIDGGGIEVVRLSPATATALDALEDEAFHVVHVATFGTSRPAARYGTLAFEGSDGRARDLNAQNFAKRCARMPEIELVVLDAVGDPPANHDVLRDLLARQTATVICLPEAGSTRSSDFVRALYVSLATGASIEEAFSVAAQNPLALAVPSTSAKPGDATLWPRQQEPAQRKAAPRRQREPAASPPAPRVQDDGAPPATPPLQSAGLAEAAREAQRTVERKRAAGAFDVFLCHNVGDKPAVMDVGRRLMAQGILPWLDQWELRPGVPWQRVLEEQIARIRAAAVFVGRGGIGPWQRNELEGFLREFNTRGCPVIPVMLPGAAGEPELPLFLRGMTWVDFRVSDPDPLARLIWGITGERPSSF